MATTGESGTDRSLDTHVDTHIHLFDPTRPQGAPYSGPRPALSGVEGPAPGATPIAAYDRALREIGNRQQIFVKLSGIIHRVNGQVSTELNTYRARLDTLMGVFGEDRVLFGSDWPNSDGVAPIDTVFAVAKEYFLAKPRPVAEKYF